MGRLPPQINDLGRILTYIFCHRPDEFGLVLAEDGSLGVKQLLQALCAEPGWGYVRRRHLEEAVALIQPPRFVLEGERLRTLAPAAQLRRPLHEGPPPLLYVGVTPKAQARVWEEGLKAPAGQELILARRQELAMKLAKRRTPAPVMVTVQAKAAAQQGVVFQGYGEELFLAQEVPRKFLQLPAPPGPLEKPRGYREVPPPPSQGAIMMDLPQFLAEALPVSASKAERAKRLAARRGAKKPREGQKRRRR